MRYTLDHKQTTRNHVLKAATKQIRERGLNNIALATVMAEVGLTHGTFYAHFRSKDDFLAAAIEAMFEESPAALLKEPRDPAPQAVLSTFVDYYLSIDHRDTLSGGCPLPFLAADAPRLNKDLQQRISRGVMLLVGLVAKQLAGLGLEHPDEDARCVVCELIGAVILARALPDTASSQAVLAAARRSVFTKLKLDVSP